MTSTISILKNNRKFLITLFLFSFLVRALFFFFFSGLDRNAWVCTDSSEYNAIATNIVRGEGIKRADGELNFRRLPGYPVFLAVCYKLFSGTDINKALWVQIFFSSFIPILIFLLSTFFFASGLLLARLASIYSAVHLGFVLHSGIILSDSLFLLLFLAFFLLLLKCMQTENTSVWLLLATGILLGSISLIRPVGHYLIILSVILILFMNRSHPAVAKGYGAQALGVGLFFTKNLRRSLWLFLGWLFVVSGWLLRNYLLTGFIFFHTLPGIHFLIYSAAYVETDLRKAEYWETKCKLIDQWDKLIEQKEEKVDRQLSDIECCHLGEQLAFNYIKKSPLLFIKHSLMHMFKTCFGLNSSTLLFWDSKSLPRYDQHTTFFDKIKRFLMPDVSNKFFIFFIFSEILFLFITMVGFLGFCVNSLFMNRSHPGVGLFNYEHLYLLLKVLPFMMLFIFITLAYGCARLRLPIEPFLIILSFHFWLRLFKVKGA